MCEGQGKTGLLTAELKVQRTGNTIGGYCEGFKEGQEKCKKKKVGRPSEDKCGNWAKHQSSKVVRPERSPWFLEEPQ